MATNNLTSLGNYNFDTSAFNIALSNNVAYVAAGDNGLLLLNISNPSKPTLLGSFATNYVTDIAITGSTAWITSENEGIKTVNVSNAFSPTVLGSYTAVGNAKSIVIAGSVAYVADWENGLLLLSTQNSNTIQKMALLPIANAKNIVIAKNNTLALVVSDNTDLVLVDVSNPYAPKQLSSFTLGTDVRNVAVLNDNTVVVAAGVGGLKILNISDSTKPTLLSTFTDISSANAVSIVDNRAFVADDDKGLTVVDLTVPTNPILLQHSSISTGTSVGIVTANNIAYLLNTTGDTQSLQTLSIPEPTKYKLSVNSPSVNEGDAGKSNLTFILTLSQALQQSGSVDFTLQSGTATAGVDLSTTTGTVQFNAGETSKKITVPVLGDTTIENDETFSLVLSNPRILEFNNASSTLTALGTIRNDDFPTLTLSIAQSVLEGNTGQVALTYTAKLSQAAPFDISVDYATQGITATAGQDFTSQSGTFKFAAGNREKSISVSVLGDTADELDEKLWFVLSNPQNAKFANNVNELRSAGTILNDDAEPAQTLQGTAKNDVLDATKNGGAGDDILDGLKGIDTMIGGDGDDTYYVDNIKDTITEEDQSQSNAGDDDLVHSFATAYTLPTNVEHLVIDGKAKGNGTGNVLDNKLTGNLAVNVLSGLAGNDTLDGGSGNDALTGGDGADTFIFSSGIKGNKNIDTLKDFVHGQDKIYLSADIFSKLATAVGFKSGSEPLSLAKADSAYLVSAAKVKAVDVNSYLLYDTKTGVLAYDEDGSGKLTASSFVTLTGKPVLTLDDFWIG